MSGGKKKYRKREKQGGRKDENHNIYDSNVFDFHLTVLGPVHITAVNSTRTIK